jgi:hypothetical protein
MVRLGKVEAMPVLEKETMVLQGPSRRYRAEPGTDQVAFPSECAEWIGLTWTVGEKSLSVKNNSSGSVMATDRMAIRSARSAR